MNIAIISSTKDKASTNIKENLTSDFNFKQLEDNFDNNTIYHYKFDDKNVKLYTIDSELISADNLDKKIDADVFIFISKHRAQEGRASLTCHAIGNFGKADKGGKEKTLCTSHSVLLKGIFIELNNNAKEPYEVTLEATHHGPFMEKPVLFVELGSNEKYWQDKNGGCIVAKSVIKAIKNNFNKKDDSLIINNDSINKKNNEISSNDKNNSRIINNNFLTNEKNNNKLMVGKSSYESTLVIGGSHYNHIANKAMLNTNLTIGHICAKYNLENLDDNMLKEAMEKITPKPKFVLLDWKGLGREKQRILGMLKKNDMEYRRSDKVL